MPIELTQHDDLETLRLEVGDKWKGTLLDIDEVPHIKFGTADVIEFTKGGKPKTKWIARLRPSDATDAATDLKWWTQNQVKFALRQAIIEHPRNYQGATIGIERLPDGEPSTKGFKPFHQYRVVIIAPGPDNYVDPYADTGAAPTWDVDDEEPF